MANDILFGKKEFTDSYNNIILNLHTLLTTEDLEKFEIDTSSIFENLNKGFLVGEEIVPVSDFNDDHLYDVFREHINNVFDEILIKFGIKSNIISIYHYETIFTVLNNIKNNELERETYSIIVNGDYGIDEKLYMLLEDFTDTPTEIIENIEVGDYLFNLIEDMLTVTRNDSNLEMLQRAYEFYSKDVRFKETKLFEDIINNKENVMMSLDLALDTINTLIKVNIDRYFTDDKLVNVNGLILEIAFTYLYYNNDSRFRLDKYVNKKYIEDTFKVTLDGVYINNVVNTIKIGV